MSPYVVSSLFLWIGIQFTQQAMEFQKEVFGWLDDVTLFPANQQQVDVTSYDFCFDDLTFPEDGKAKEHDVELDIPYVSDILEGNDWMDEKIDLSILDSISIDYGAFSGVNKSDSIEVGPEIDSLVDVYFQQNAILPLETDLLDQPSSPISNIQDVPSIPEAFCISEATTTSSSHASILPEMGLQLSCSPLESSWSSTSSPGGVPSISDGNLSDVSEGSSSNDQAFSPVNYYIEVAAEDVVKPTNKGRKKESTSSKLKVQKKDVSFSPYYLKKESRKERKKVQNKEAAARYRTKKREQDKVLGDEVEVLENEQKTLQEKHDSLKTEIKYLKSLMREMFKARGLLK